MNAKTLTQSFNFQSTTVRPTMQRTLMMSMIALSMGGMSVAAQAQTQQQKEIEQLRQEVQALRGLIEQQKVQNAQTATAIASHAVTQIGFQVPDLSVIEDLKQKIAINSLS